MKKLILITLLVTVIYTRGQCIQKIDKEYTTLTLSIDPSSSYKEKGLNFTSEFTLVSYFGYVKAGIQAFPGLTNGYFDLTGGVGLNQKSTLFKIETRMFQGIRGGRVWRGVPSDIEGYPIFGLDGGFEMYITQYFLIGWKGTYDYREDMKYSGADPLWRFSGFLTATIVINENLKKKVKNKRL